MPAIHLDTRVVLSPGLKEAPVLDRMCSQFVLTLTVRHAGRFNVRRDWNSAGSAGNIPSQIMSSMMSLTNLGRHRPASRSSILSRNRFPAARPTAALKA